ncbi:MAG: hypothetical protein JXB34_10695, partial [Bacteroidales bacterium]|nr:hypothetical protein [Bacteroidales bacterium]
MKKITIVMLTLLTSLWNLMAQPATGAPEPPARAAADVISVFSGAYTDLAGTDFNPNWGQGTVVSFEEIDGNNAMRYSNLNYQGTQLASAIDASLMDTLHLDLYTDDIAISAEIFLISPGAVPVEKSFSLPTEPGVWQSVDIALSEFSDVVDISNVIQFKITDTAGSTIYFDNLYFYRPAPAAGTDASLSDLQIDGVTIANFNTNTLNYFFGLEEGTTVVPTVTVTTTDENAEAVITAAAQIPDTTVIVVTAADGTTTLTYRVAFAIAFPATGAPAPPARNASDVISVFSGAYTDLSGTDFNPNWGQSTQVSFTDFDGNNTMKYANLNYQGTVLGGNVDVSLMDTLHLDMW